MIDLGTDIDSELIFKDGDIVLINGYGNLGQAICNRLNSDLDTYDLFYARYGGELYSHMGDLNIPSIHEYIRIEIEDILRQDPRIASTNCTVTKIDKNTVECQLKVLLYDNTDNTTYNLVITAENGVELAISNESDNL